MSIDIKLSDAGNSFIESKLILIENNTIVFDYFAP